MEILIQNHGNRHNIDFQILFVATPSREDQSQLLVVQGRLVKQSFQKSFTEPSHHAGDRSDGLIAVLVVDENEPFRRIVRSTLSTSRN